MKIRRTLLAVGMSAMTLVISGCGPSKSMVKDTFQEQQPGIISELVRLNLTKCKIFNSYTKTVDGETVYFYRIRATFEWDGKTDGELPSNNGQANPKTHKMVTKEYTCGFTKSGNEWGYQSDGGTTVDWRDTYADGTKKEM